jgi:hypothetical protein
LKNRIRTDLNDWKSYLAKGANKHNYNWFVVDALFKTHGHSIGEVVTCYAEVLVDFVACSEDVSYSYDYMYEIISFYNKNFSQQDKEEMKTIIIENLKYVNDTKLDNSFIVEVWAGLVSIFSSFKLFYFSDLNLITENDGEEQLRCIFEVVVRANQDKEKCYDQLIKINFIKNNLNLFDMVFKQCSD